MKEKKEKKPFKEWGVVKFLKEKAPSLAGDLVGLAGDLSGNTLLQKVGDKIKGSTELTAEQKELALLKLQNDFELNKAYLQDVQNARDNETARDTSEHSSWLSKNIHEIIALLVVGGFMVMVYGIFAVYFFSPKKIDLQDIKLLFEIFGLTSIVTLILGYLYGRSKPQS